MAVKTIFVNILANANQFKRELRGAVIATNEANIGLKRYGKAAGVAGVALGAGLVVGLEKSAKAAMVAQEQTARLDQAFRRSHVAMSDFTGQIDKAEKSSRNLGFTNAAVRNSLGSLVIATHSGRKAIADLSVAEDLARFKHVDLATATKSLTMAMAGSQRALKQLGINVPKVTTAQDAARKAYDAAREAIKRHYDGMGKLTEAQKEQRQKALDLAKSKYDGAKADAKVTDSQSTAAKVIAKVRDLMHGQAEAYSKTAGGAMEKYRAQMDNLKEVMGKAVLPAISAIAGALAKFLGVLSDHPTLLKALALGLGIMAVAMMAAGAASFFASSALFTTTIAVGALEVSLLPLVAAFAVVAAAVYLGIKYWPQIKDAMEAVWQWIKSTFVPIWETLRDAAVTAWEKIKNALVTTWEAIKTAATVAWEAIKTVITTVWNSIVWVFEHLTIAGLILSHWNQIKTFTVDVFNAIVGFFSALPGRIADAFVTAWEAVKGRLSGAFDWLKTHAGQVISGVVGTFTSLPGKIGDAIGGAMHFLKEKIESLFAWKTVVGWVEHALGFSEHSEFFGDIGMKIVRSIARGVGEAKDLLVNAIEKIAGSLNPFSGGLQGGGVSGKGGTGVPTGGGSTLPLLLSWAKQEGIAVTSTTSGNHVKGSFHYQGRAIDVSGSAPMMAKFFLDTIKRFGVGRIKELFYDPMGYFVDNGRAVRGAIGGHSDHVHLALAAGGIANKATMALIGEAGPEAVVPLRRWEQGWQEVKQSQDDGWRQLSKSYADGEAEARERDVRNAAQSETQTRVTQEQLADMIANIQALPPGFNEALGIFGMTQQVNDETNTTSVTDSVDTASVESSSWLSKIFDAVQPLNDSLKNIADILSNRGGGGGGSGGGGSGRGGGGGGDGGGSGGAGQFTQIYPEDAGFVQVGGGVGDTGLFGGGGAKTSGVSSALAALGTLSPPHGMHRDGPFWYSVEGSKGMPAPLIPNISNWLKQYTGRGLSPAQAIGINKWWPAHYPQIVKGMARGGVFTKPWAGMMSVAERGPEGFVPLGRGDSLGGEVHIHLHGGTYIGGRPEQIARDLEGPLRQALYRTKNNNGSLEFG